MKSKATPAAYYVYCGNCKEAVENDRDGSMLWLWEHPVQDGKVVCGSCGHTTEAPKQLLKSEVFD